MNRMRTYKVSSFFHISTLLSVTLLVIVSFLIPLNLQAASYTLGTVSDGDDNSPNRPQAMTADLNHLKTELPIGWNLDAISWEGDIAYDGSTLPIAVQGWKASTASSSPLFFTPGNHDAETTADVEFLRAYFAQYPSSFNVLRSNLPQASTTNYSFDVGDIHVAVVNQYTSTSSDKDLSLGAGGGYIHDQVFNWLKNDLKSTTKVHKVVTGHEPAYPQIRHVGSSLDADDANRDKFINLLSSYGVEAHLVGHTHASRLAEDTFEYDNNKPSFLGGGLWELDSGVFGTKASGYNEDAFPSIGYFHSNSNTFGDYQIKLVQGTGSTDWAAPTVKTKSYNDLTKVIFVNTWQGSGTGKSANGLNDLKYYVDYTPVVESNPNWSANNNGKWWEPAFNPSSAGWKDGELSVGYRTGPETGWLNTKIDAFRGNSDEQVHSIMSRVVFPVVSTFSIDKLSLDTDYDDGLLVWLNGTLIFNGTDTQLPAPTSGNGSEYFDKLQTVTTHNPTGLDKATPSYVSLDVSSYKGLLKNGSNTLAFWNINSTIGSSDLLAAIRLTATTKPIPTSTGTSTPGTSTGTTTPGTTTGTTTSATSTQTVSLRQGEQNYQGMTDTYMNATAPTTSYGDSAALLTDGDNPDAGILMKWDLSSIPKNAQLTSASIVYTISNSSAQTYNLYESKRPWIANSANWNTYNGTTLWQSAGGEGNDDRYTTVLSTLGGNLGLATSTFNSQGKETLQRWITGSSTNNGFILSNYNGATDGLQFNSSENGDITTRPKLLLTFTIPSTIGTTSSTSTTATSTATSTTSTSIYATSTATTTPPATIGFTAYIDAADENNLLYASKGNVLNAGAWDGIKSLIDFFTGSTTPISIHYLESIVGEQLGAEDGTVEENGTSGTRALPLYPALGTDAYTEFGTTTNIARLTAINTDNTQFTVELSGLNPSKKYTLVALGTRGRYANRWCSYQIQGATAFENKSSIGTILGTKNIANDSTTYQCGANYGKGYVAKWSNIKPTGSTLSLVVRGVQVGNDPASKPYLSALKLLEQ